MGSNSTNTSASIFGKLYLDGTEIYGEDGKTIKTISELTEEEKFFYSGGIKMNENWYALCISILTKLTPEQAFMCMENPNFKHAALEVDEIKEMKRLREQEHWSCKDLAEMFGIHKCTIARLFKKIEQTG